MGAVGGIVMSPEDVHILTPVNILLHMAKKDFKIVIKDLEMGDYPGSCR